MLWQEGLFIEKCLKNFGCFFFFEVFQFQKNELNECKNATASVLCNIAASTEVAYLQYENHSKLFICKNISY